MSMAYVRLPVALSALLAVLALTAAAPAARAQQGSIGGRVTDQNTTQPIVGARVAVVGTAIVTQTNAEGRYVLASVKPGQATVKVSAIGYGAATKALTVTAGGIAAEDFTLSLQPFSLDEIVVTAAGEQAKRELGHQVSSITADSLVATAPITDINQLLQSRAPGVSVFESPLTGAEARVRIRGANSLSLSNEPIYYIDGIRMESATGSSSIGIGGTNPSRLNDLNPEEIESVEVVKGPSASTLYGTDAVNGVIVIKTKRGRAGAPRWNVYSELGVIEDYNKWPTAYRAWRTGTTASTTSLSTNGVQCLLSQVAAGTCVQDSITAYNLFEDPLATPVGTGWRGQLGAQVSGGTDAVRYFLSSEYEEEIGLLKMPDFAWGRFTTKWAVPEVPYDYYRPNARDRVSLRANLQTTFSPKLDVQVSSGFLTSDQRLPQTDNNTTGLLSNAFGGPGHRDNWRFTPDTAVLYGYRAFTPDEMFAEVVGQRINRFIGSGTLNWRPNAWLAGRLITGIDYTSRTDTDLCKQFECTPFGQDSLGYKEDNRTGFHNYTVDGNLAATYALNSDLHGKTTVGVQFFHSLFERNGAFARDLPPGATTVSAGATQSSSEATTETKTLGGFIEQQIAYRERLYVTTALRGDDNSAFGKDFHAAYYPKLGLSYVISEESFFPAPSWLSNLRLRGAIGASGQQPGSTDALAFYSPVTATLDAENKAALVFSSCGNDNLKAERATEVELGFDAAALQSRVSFELTYYRKRAKDALIATIVPPFAGVCATQFKNIGAVRNAGLELQLNAMPINRPNLSWDLTFSLSHNTNEIEDLGKDPSTGEDIPPIVGTTIQQREGYPIDGYWQRPILGYNDLNGDGLIAASEVIVGDSARFIGPSLPPTEATFSTGVDFLNRRLRISALFDYKHGRWQLNGTERIRCESRLNCDAEIDRNSPLWKQARVVALKDHPARTQWGFFEPADAVRWRELAITYELPAAFARAMRAGRVTLTASGRNLKRWTKYSGLDTESGYLDGGLQTDFQTQPPGTYWILRLNASF
jgi:TonB-linked SusC/RagA family outer membrane protein